MRAARRIDRRVARALEELHELRAARADHVQTVDRVSVAGGGGRIVPGYGNKARHGLHVLVAEATQFIDAMPIQLHKLAISRRIVQGRHVEGR